MRDRERKIVEGIEKERVREWESGGWWERESGKWCEMRECKKYLFIKCLQKLSELYSDGLWNWDYENWVAIIL